MEAQRRQEVLGVRLDRAELLLVGVYGLRSSAGDDQDDPRAACDLSAFDRPHERAERRAARAVGDDAGRLAEQARVRSDVVVGHGDDPSACRQCRTDRQVAVRRVSDRERCDLGVGLHT